MPTNNNAARPAPYYILIIIERERRLYFQPILSYALTLTLINPHPIPISGPGPAPNSTPATSPDPGGVASVVHFATRMQEFLRVWLQGQALNREVVMSNYLGLCQCDRRHHAQMSAVRLRFTLIITLPRRRRRMHAQAHEGAYTTAYNQGLVLISFVASTLRNRSHPCHTAYRRRGHTQRVRRLMASNSSAPRSRG